MAKQKIIKVRVEKVDELGIVFGFGIVCTKDGEDYFDTDDQHFPDDEMLASTAAYMSGDRIAKEGHRGEAIGQVIFGFPLTQDIAKAMDITSRRSGFIIGMRPRSDILEKFRSGDLNDFSMGGGAAELEDV